MADKSDDKPNIWQPFTDIVGGQRDEGYVNLANDLSKKIGIPVNPANGDSLTYNSSLGRWDKGRKGFYTAAEVGGAEWTIYGTAPAASFGATAIDIRVGGTGGSAQAVPFGAKAVVARATMFNYAAAANIYTVLTPAGNTVVSLRSPDATGTTIESCVVIPLGAASDGTLATVSQLFTLVGGAATTNVFIQAYAWLF